MSDKKYNVRLTGVSDIDTVLDIFEYARLKMRQSGNMTQWVNGYPSLDAVMKDIEDGTGYIIEEDGAIAGVFTFVIGEDPFYADIQGQWLDNKPYGTIHRIASAPGRRGIADTALEFCMKSGVGIRIDTHADNIPMLGWIAKHGFRYCGIVHVADGTPRRAFQLP